MPKRILRILVLLILLCFSDKKLFGADDLTPRMLTLTSICCTSYYYSR